MTQPKNTDPTQFIDFMKEDASHICIARNAILYFYQDKVTYKSTLKLVNGETIVISERYTDIQTKCSLT